MIIITQVADTSECLNTLAGVGRCCWLGWQIFFKIAGYMGFMSDESVETDEWNVEMIIFITFLHLLLFLECFEDGGLITGNTRWYTGAGYALCMRYCAARALCLFVPALHCWTGKGGSLVSIQLAGQWDRRAVPFWRKTTLDKEVEEWHGWHPVNLDVALLATDMESFPGWPLAGLSRSSVNIWFVWLEMGEFFSWSH